ncbi:hypothetical protein DAPK24_039260 [Pichia kluyveri]|uniref:Uncharacterized protein n=1 Tax=Pichia kluyveri TaxID=36015 RepID=A0AAV5R9T2_PICKL|nr:hypothetical protein DAPK24_039260 [Pichia kluyveri]
MGLFYAKVLDCTAPDLHYQLLKWHLKILVQLFFKLLWSRTIITNLRETLKEIEIKLHARDCTAPAPASASNAPKQGRSAFTTTTSNGFAWVASNV